LGDVLGVICLDTANSLHINWEEAEVGAIVRRLRVQPNEAPSIELKHSSMSSDNRSKSYLVLSREIVRTRLNIEH
jgi:hypothetical protein